MCYLKGAGAQVLARGGKPGNAAIQCAPWCDELARCCEGYRAQLKAKPWPAAQARVAAVRCAGLAGGGGADFASLALASASAGRGMTVALVFAAIAKDVDRHFPTLFRAVARQTVPLDELATVISGVGAREAAASCDALRRKVEAQLRAAHTCEGHGAAAPLPRLRLRCVAALQNQATSRQQAVALVKSTIISYMDADDSPLAVRNEVVRGVFATYSPRAFLHSWTNAADYERTQDVPRQVSAALRSKTMFGEAVFDMARARPPGQDWLHAKMHHAHVSVAASVMRSVRWATGPEWFRREDSKFVGDVVLHFGRHPDTAIFMQGPLSLYIPGQYLPAQGGAGAPCKRGAGGL